MSAGQESARSADGRPAFVPRSGTNGGLATKSTAFLPLLLVGLFSSTATAASGEEPAALRLDVATATVDPDGVHLVLDVQIDNPSSGDAVVLLTEVLVFLPEQPEAGCPGDSPVLGGSPALQAPGPGPAADASACLAEPRSPGPHWKRGLLRLPGKGRANILVAVPGEGLPPGSGTVRFGASWAPAEELPRALVRRAFRAEGLFLVARAASTSPGGGGRVASLFSRRAVSADVQVHGRQDGEPQP